MTFFITKYGPLIREWGGSYYVLLEMSRDKIALWKYVRVDDWAVERVIIVSIMLMQFCQYIWLTHWRRLGRHNFTGFLFWCLDVSWPWPNSQDSITENDIYPPKDVFKMKKSTRVAVHVIGVVLFFFFNLFWRNIHVCDGDGMPLDAFRAMYVNLCIGSSCWLDSQPN